jgi:hypothetical protein
MLKKGNSASRVWRVCQKKVLGRVKFGKYSQTCVQRPHLGPEKSGRLTEVSDKTDIYTGH